MATQILDFSQSSDFTFNAAEIDFTGSLAQLLKGPDAQLFNEDYADDTGFTYDSAEAEFTGGLVQQKDVTPVNSVFASDYSGSANPITTEADLLWNKAGSLTAILTGLPTIVSGYIDCTADQGVAYAYTTNSIETHKFIYKPNYNVTPSGGNTNIIGSWNNTNNNDKFYLMGGASGGWRTHLYDSSGVQVFGLTAITAPTFTLGVDIEVEIVVDSTAGTFRVFADGILLSTQSPGAWTRGSIVSNVKMGNGIVYTESQASFDKYIYFTDAQHTANYTPGYTVPGFLYAETLVTLPDFVYSGLDNIVGYTGMTTTDAGAPKYVINGRYWTGSMWGISDNSYSQASTQALVTANLSSYPSVADTVTVGLVFPGSNTISSASDLTFNYNGVAYPADALITSNIINSMDALQTFVETVVVPANTLITYIIDVGGIDMWFSGVWTTSDGTPAQSNSAADVNTNAATLDLSGGKSVKAKIYLQSTNGLVTPSITFLQYAFSFDVPTVNEPELTSLFGVLRKLDGTVAASSILEIEYESAGITNPYVAEGTIVRPSKLILNASVTGEVQTDIVVSSLYTRKYKFTLRYTLTGDTSESTEVWGYAEIPDLVSVNVNTLTFSESA